MDLSPQASKQYNTICFLKVLAEISSKIYSLIGFNYQRKKIQCFKDGGLQAPKHPPVDAKIHMRALLHLEEEGDSFVF